MYTERVSTHEIHVLIAYFLRDQRRNHHQIKTNMKNIVLIFILGAIIFIAAILIFFLICPTIVDKNENNWYIYPLFMVIASFGLILACIGITKYDEQKLKQKLREKKR